MRNPPVEMTDVANLLPNCFLCHRTRLQKPDLVFFLIKCGHLACKTCKNNVMAKNPPKCPVCKVRVSWRGSDVEIVPRAAWSAGAPEVVATIATPVKHIFISHTVTPPCHTKNECSARMRSMQNYHKSIGWGDIGYNFVIGVDGRVYEGVGWSREGVHTYAWNKKSYGIAFVGNYMAVKPNDGMLRAARKLIVCGVKMGVIAEDRWLHGARDATCTASPGDELYAIIKQWPRFQGGPLSVYNCY